MNQIWYDTFPFQLSSFQKIAIDALIEGNHSLSCVPTGSGKTVPALFAIDFFTKNGKKVIYTSPIKALSNQKFYEFRKKFPNLTVGLLTGDIKLFPNADVVIMTAEVLQHQFLSNEMHSFDNVQCIIHDEIHMINDPMRGHVWEELIMKCPSHIQMVLLSATLNDPHQFGLWIESLGPKRVRVAEERTRPVPLHHYTYLTYNNFFRKRLKRTQLDEIEPLCHKLQPIFTTDKGEFNENSYSTSLRIRKLMKQHNYDAKPLFSLSSLFKILVEKDLLPAVCFVLSKKQIEYIATNIDTELLPFDSKVPYTIEKECHAILRSKFANNKEYFQLPEFQSLVKMLEKGIAIHHSGMVPILRELVELLFERGFIKVLFATETFSIGLNMPIRTTIFTNLFKFDGSKIRLFHPHEFVQAYGRAGRRGIDEQGHVIHMLNLFQEHETLDMKVLLKGTPPSLKSQFKFSYHLLLSDSNVKSFYKRSFHEKQLEKDKTVSLLKLQGIKSSVAVFESQIQHTPDDIIERYLSLNSAKSTKKLKKNRILQEDLLDSYPHLEFEIQQKRKQKDKQNEYNNAITKHCDRFDFQDKLFVRIERFLHQHGYLDGDMKITTKGTIASKIHLLPCILITEHIHSIVKLDRYNIIYLIGSLIPFPNQQNYNEVFDNTNFAFMSILDEMEKDIQKLLEFENDFDSGEDYTLHRSAFPYLQSWINAQDDHSCLGIFAELQKDLGCFTGEFIKFILTIHNVKDEFIKVAEYLGDMNFLHELQQVPSLLMKYIATNQSLYV